MWLNDPNLKDLMHFDLDLLNVLRPPFCTLATHSWLNWVNEDDWWGWGWLERKARRQKDYIKIRPEAPGVGAKDWIPNFAIIGNCRFRNRQCCHTPWRVLGGCEIHSEAHYLPQDCWCQGDQSKDSRFVWGSFTTDHPPGPTKSPFMTYRVRGILLPRSSMGTLLLDWFYCMFYDHFSARSLLAKLGRWGRWWGWGWLERKARRH